MGGVGLVHRLLADPVAPAEVGVGGEPGVGVGAGAGEQADPAGAGLGEVVEDAQDGGLVVVVDPGGDRAVAGLAVADHRDAGPVELADQRVLVGRVDHHGAVQGDVAPDVVPGGGGQDHQGVAAAERGAGGGPGHLGEVGELGEGERLLAVGGDGQADQARPAGAQGTGGGRGAVAEALGDLADPASGLVGQAPLTVQRVGDRGDRHSGGCCHIPDLKPAPDVVRWWVADRSGWLLLSWRTDRMAHDGSL